MSLTHLTPDELAARWGVSKATLGNWRYARQGPQYLKLNGQVRYTLTAVEEYERSTTVMTNSGAA